MIRFRAVFFLIAALTLTSVGRAEDLGIAVEEAAAVPEEGLPNIIISGLDAYALEGAEAAIKAWIKGGPNESDPNILSVVDMFKEVETRYGLYIGYEVISIKDLTASSKLVSLQLNYEKGPFFCRFLCYKQGDAWLTTGRLAFDTDPQKILT